MSLYREKRAAWSRAYEFDFGDFEEVIAGAVLSAPSVTASPSGLTIGSPVVSGTDVNVQISGGTAGVAYLVTCTVTLGGGPSTVDQVGTLSVIA